MVSVLIGFILISTLSANINRLKVEKGPHKKVEVVGGLKNRVYISKKDWKIIPIWNIISNKTLVASSKSTFKLTDVGFYDEKLRKIRKGQNSKLTELQKILTLIERKYGVHVPESQIYSGRWLQSGSYLLTFDYINPDKSLWLQLNKAIREEGDKIFNFYLNHQRDNKLMIDKTEF